MRLQVFVRSVAASPPGREVADRDVGRGEGEDRRVEVIVEAESGARLADLLDALAAQEPARVEVGADGRRSSDVAVRVRGVRVPASALLGHPPLLDGAVLDLGPGDGGADPQAVIASATPARSASALVHLHVVAGPDTGRIHPLGPGRHTLGRGAEASLPIADPSLSREHARLEVSGRVITVADLGSTNGTRIDGAAVGAMPVALTPGAVLQLGTSVARVRTPSWPPAAAAPDGAGRLLVTRSPRPTGALDPSPVTFPEPPAAHTGPRLPLLASLLPLLLSAVLAVVMQSPSMVLFGLMSPVLAVGSWWSERRSGRRSSRSERSAYAAALAAAQAELAAALAVETERRQEADPDPAQVASICAGPLTPLWDRTGDSAVRMRVGMAQVAAATPMAGPHPPAHVGPVPAVVDLGDDGWLGLAGPPELTSGCARWVLGQLAARYSPTTLTITSSAGLDGPSWVWLRRLPHYRGAPEGLADLPGPGGPGGPESGGPETARVLVVTDEAVTWSRRPGLHVLGFATGADRLPTATNVTLRLDAPHHATLTAGAALEVDPDLVPLAWAQRLAADLHPLRDAGGPGTRSAIPDSVGLLDLLGETHGVSADPRGAPELAELWTRSPRSTAVPIGHSGDRPLVIDLAADGPHALVGGTTGSGKSELLVSLVAALAAVNRPDELAFVLVDYKGGAAFGACAQLPHVVGLVTDLDHHLTERALASLSAELRRRERLLAGRAAADLTAYQSNWRDGDPRLGRLVIVVDEFRSLAEELPDFVEGLVRIASLGRSLGVHLVVATQRPAGVVTADMRANLGLRIALRMRDIADSIDVLDSPLAARLPGDRPGRALVASARTPLVEMQTARVTDRRATAAASVRVLSVAGRPTAVEPSGCGTDLDLLVAAAHSAMTLVGSRPMASPWLPPLPARLTSDDLSLPALDAVPLGRVDRPDEQRQADWAWSPATDGHLGVIGGPGSGRTSALLAVAGQLARSAPPSRLQLYAVHVGSLAQLDGLPHVGASVGVDDLARLARVLELLSRPQGDPGQVAADRELGEGAAAPRLLAPLSTRVQRVLLVDDWERVAEALDQARAGVLRDQLVGVLRGGPAEGWLACVAGGRALLSGGLAPLLRRRVLLSGADPVDVALAGIPPGLLPTRPTPGRGVDLGERAEVQLALAAPDPPTPGERPAAEVAGWRVPPLPDRARRAQLGAVAGPELLPLGTDGVTAHGIRPAAGERRIAVLGPRGSGRTTALLALARAAHLAGMPVAWVGSDPRRRPAGPPADAMADPPAALPWPVLGSSDVDELVTLRRAHPDLVVIVDDVGRLAETPMGPVLAEIERLVDLDAGVIAVAATPREVLEGFRQVAAVVASHGVGVLLGRVSPGEEAALGLRGPVWGIDHPGRGVLARAGQAIPLQLVEPDS